ncbi:hypothetical protein O3P69_007804 [Scylla paramamosain]|uniref:Uncharacterized protein n=1 Tax=Scylla paramamosain TaxID=85552 RepID=A0AAW0SHP5_SCYPA
MQDQRRVGTRAFDVRKGEVLCVQDRDKWNANTDTVDSLALAWRGAACGAAGPVPPCIASSPRHKKRINRCPSHRGRVKVPGGMSLSDLNDQHESPSTLQPSPSLADTSCFSQPCTIAITTRPVTTVHRDKHFVLSTVRFLDAQNLVRNSRVAPSPSCCPQVYAGLFTSAGVDFGEE